MPLGMAGQWSSPPKPWTSEREGTTAPLLLFYAEAVGINDVVSLCAVVEGDGQSRWRYRLWNRLDPHTLQRIHLRKGGRLGLAGREGQEEQNEEEETPRFFFFTSHPPFLGCISPLTGAGKRV